VNFAVSMLARLRCTQINQFAGLALYHHVAVFSQLGVVHWDRLALAIECGWNLERTRCLIELICRAGKPGRTSASDIFCAESME
jgi:hypothetical protein